MKKGRIIAVSVICVSIIAIGISAAYLFNGWSRDTAIEADMIPLTASSDSKNAFTPASLAVNAMRVGWNLGNTLDSIDNKKNGIYTELSSTTPEEFYERYWGNPVTTEDMIKSLAQAGFGAIRVPVTWADHMDDDFNIRVEWLYRVEEVVNYVLDNRMYCIINLHHDTGSGTWPWLRIDPKNPYQLHGPLKKVWQQIAEYFRDYDERLLFEGFNEILDINDDWDGNEKVYDIVNNLNQTFVDAVRGTGGKNSERILVVSTYAAGIGEAKLAAFALPTDTAEGRLIVSVHTYAPAGFTWQQNQAHWLTTYSDWVADRDGSAVENEIANLQKHLVDKGIPVIISEFAAYNKNNTADRINYISHFIQTAKSYGITCFWWDDGGSFENAEDINGSTIFNRYKNEWFFPELADALVMSAE